MLHGWESFLVTAAQSGAALIGLLFVSVTVGTEFSTPKMLKGARAFVTPTLIHFAGVLFLSLAMLAPRPSQWPITCHTIRALSVMIARRFYGVDLSFASFHSKASFERYASRDTLGVSSG